MLPGRVVRPGELARVPGENLALRLGDNVTDIPAEPGVTRMRRLPRTDIARQLTQRDPQRR